MPIKNITHTHTHTTETFISHVLLNTLTLIAMLGFLNTSYVCTTVIDPVELRLTKLKSYS